MGLLREVLAYVCMFVYQIIAWVYELFINISRVTILSSDDIEPIYQRITLILSIIMVFYITFEFVKFVVQPDGLVDKEKGAQKTVLKMVIVVVLIAFVPSIFNWGYKLQNVIFDNQLFSKIILGKQDVEMRDIGRDFSANMLSMFYYVDEDINWAPLANGTDCGELDCKQIVSLNLDYLRQNGTIPYLTMGLDKEANAIEPSTQKKVKEFKIHFNGLFAVGVGIFVAWMLILYCVDAGVRVVQLIFLQIIAPIPIIGYLSPKKDGIFQKWVKQCITTYLDLFIRVGIIYFILLVAQILTSAITDGQIMENATSQDGLMKTFMFVAIIMGLLLFAKKAPNMLKELFPSTNAASGNFGLGLKDRPAVARAVGATLGGSLGLARRGVVSAINRHRRNKENGQKPIWTKEGIEQRRKRQENRKAQRNAAKDQQNAQTVSERKKKLENQKAKAKAASDAYQKIKNDPNATQAEKDEAKQKVEREAKTYAEMLRKAQGRKPLSQSTADELNKHRKASGAAYTQLETARKELDELKKNNPNDTAAINEAQKKVNAAQENYNKERKKLEDFTNTNEEYKKYKQADKATEETRSSLVDAVSNSKKATEEYQKAEQEKEKAHEEYKSKINDPNATQAEKDAARKKLEEAEKKVNSTRTKAEQAQEEFEKQKERYRTVATGDTDTATNKLDMANEQVAKDYNERYGSVLGAGLMGGLAGAANGMWTGGHATTGKEIFTKTGEAWKKDTKAIRANETFLDNGGASGVQGFIDKTVASIQTGLGVDTTYERTISSTKPREEQIKELDAQINLSKDASSAADNADGIARKKSQDSKAEARHGEIKTGLKDSNGNDIMAEPLLDENGHKVDETVGQLVRRYHAKAALKKNELDAATQQVSTLDKEHKEAELNQRLANTKKQQAQAKVDELKNNPTATAEAKAAAVKELEEAKKNEELCNAVEAHKRAALAEAQTKKDQLAIDATNAQYAAENVEKNAARDEITQILQGKTKNCHAAIIQQVMEGKESLQSAALNPQLRERVRQELFKIKTPAEAARLYNALITQQITKFDDYDDICTAYKNATSSASRTKTNLAETNRQIQQGATSDRYKSAQDATNGGK